MIQPKTIKQSEKGEFQPLQPDVYQVQIIDVEEREGTKYGSSDKIMQFMFKTAVVDGDSKGQSLFIFTSQSWFGGGKGSNPSKLFNLIKAVYDHYEEDTDLNSVVEISDKEINGLIGKQLRVSVTVNNNNKNKITGFMPIKKEIKYQQENVDPDDIDIP